MDMNEQMSLDEFKKKVRVFGIETRHFSTEVVNDLMKAYDSDFPEFLRDNWTIPEVFTAMIMSY